METKKTFRLTIEYDGRCFCGWQRQASDTTVQGEIEAALKVMTRQDIALIGSGRTDAGVHALGQVASFSCATRLLAEQFFRGLNSLLPESVVVLDCAEAPEGFHARYDVKSKRYRYLILNRPVPTALDRGRVWHIRHPLDLGAMNAAAAHLAGVHDFSAFEGAGSPRSNQVRQIFFSQWTREERGVLRYEVEADGFLRYMVRNLVGTMVEAGLGRRPPDEIPEILASRDRNMAGPTAPPQGLYLVRVNY